jgi:hypothetical protein
MARFRVPTSDGVFEVETDATDPTEEQLLDLIAAGGAENEPGMLRKGAAFTARVGLPILGGIAAAPAGPLAAAGGAAVGGAAGEALAEKILGEDTSPTEIALSAGLSAIPAGPAARAAGKVGLSVAKRVGLHAVEGASQGALAAEAESLVHEGTLAGPGSLATGAVGGALLGGGIGAVHARATRTPEVPLAPQTASAEAVQEAQGKLFTRVPGLGGEVPPRSPIPDERLDELLESTDRLFPHLDDVSRLSLKTTIADQADQILEHTRSVQSHERTQALADELVLDLSRPLPEGTALNAEQMKHVVDTIEPLQTRVTSLAGEVAASPDDDVLKLKLQKATTQLANAVYSYSGARAEAGRTLNILRVQASALARGDTKAILAARKLGVDADQVAKIIAMTPNDSVSQYRQLRDLHRPDWKDKVRWYYYSNILSGPQTHVRNLFSNTVNLALRPLTTPLAAAAGRARQALGGREQEVFAGETGPALVGALRGLPDAWNKSLFMLKNGFSLNQVDDFELKAPEVGGGIATNVVGRSLAAADEFFRTLGFSMELNGGAFARARKAALKEGLKGRALVDRTAELSARILDERPADLVAQAERFARRTTFQETDNPVANGLVRFRDAFGPAGSFLVPFVRTPANIFRQGLQFSPAGLLTKAARAEGRAGQQAVGEAVLGSMLLTPIAWLASTGQVTGAAPTDAGERDAFYAEGKRPNSIRIGDQWVGYSELGPLVLPISVVANAFDAFKRTGDEASLDQVVGQIVGQVGRSTLDQSYLTSLSAVFQALEDPQRYGATFVQNLAAGLIPAIGLQRNITRATDPFVRQPTNLVEGLEKNVPGLSERVPPRLDAFGQPVTHPTGPRALLVPTVTPALVDPVRDELDVIGVSPDPLRRQQAITVGEERIPLSPDEDLAVRRATGTLRIVLLKDLMASPEYQDASAEEKSSAVKKALRRAGTVVQEGVRDLVRGDRQVTFESLTEGLEDPEVVEQRAPEPQAAAPVTGPRTRFDDLFSRIGSTVGVDPTFLKAVAKTESSFNPDAKGPPTKYGTAIGMFQILPSTFRLFEAEARRILGREPSIANPVDNVLVGALFYRDLLDRTGNDPAAAATRYHGGEDPQNWGPKTKAYARLVAETYAKWSQ